VLFFEDLEGISQGKGFSNFLAQSVFFLERCLQGNFDPDNATES